MPISVPKRNTSTSLWPPSLVGHKESDEERKARLRLEADARRVSEKIDQQLEEEDKQRKKKGVEAKILLLGTLSCFNKITAHRLKHDTGQAESGKSTVLKNFQLYFAPKAFEVEVCLPRIRNTTIIERPRPDALLTSRLKCGDP